MASVKRKRVAIVGAGPCGLSQLLAFKQAVQEQRVEIVCFERQSDWGGLWLYTSQIGIDACNEPIHSSMYRQLWSNGPNEILEYADYSFEQHFGRPISSYPPRTVIYDYLVGRAKAGDIRKFIRFRTAVRYVDFDIQTQQFQVTVEDLLSNKPLEYLTFDHVIIATGHYSVPNMPDFEGVSLFPGRVLHSHEFRGADEFINQNVLIVGGGYSGEDIAMQCHKFGSRSITISYRSCPMNNKWPDNIREVPLLQRVHERTAYFKDGTQVDHLDCIIMCTGYRHHHPYMAEHLRLRCSGNPFLPPNLYKGIFWVTEPRLAYLGMLNTTYSFTLFDAQAALVRDVFLGHVKLPADVPLWQTCDTTIRREDHRTTRDEQTAYMRDILFCCEPHTAPMVDLDRVHLNIDKYFLHREQNIMTYRDQSFPSVYPPYKESPVNRIPWIKAIDDLIESFLASIDNGTQ